MNILKFVERQTARSMRFLKLHFLRALYQARIGNNVCSTLNTSVSMLTLCITGLDIRMLLEALASLELD